MSEKVNEMILGVRSDQVALEISLARLKHAEELLLDRRKEVAIKRDKLDIAMMALMAAIEQDIDPPTTPEPHE